MEWETSRVLTKILGRREMDKVPPDIAKKIEKYFEDRFEEFLQQQALNETNARKARDQCKEYKDSFDEITVLKEENEVRLEKSEQNVAELRKQLDEVRGDVSKFQQSVAKLEAENIEFKRQRDNYLNERDALQSSLESKTAEIERLRSDVRELEKQLKTAIEAKYDAITKYDEIQGKEATLEYKERRMEQDKSILQSQLQSLTETYNSNMEELMAIRREKQFNRLDLETKLNERIEELNIANGSIAHLQEANQELLNRIEELTSKRKEEADEAVKMIDCYKNELLAKSKLADIYKSENEDSKNHVGELTRAVTELKKLLQEAIDEYGVLETKYKEEGIQNSELINEKENVIENLRAELKNANELLQTAKDENLEQVIERVAPSAAATSKMIKSNMTLTEIYTEYVKAVENLRAEQRETAKLRIQMKEILQEIEERAPEINKRNIEYDKLVEANAQIREQLDNLITERVIEREQLQEATSKYAYLDRENKRLRQGQADLSRQVCFLLKENEHIRGGIVSDGPDQSVCADMSAGEVISKKLVTFGTCEELHENNQKLLLLVRDLSTRLEEIEEVQSQFDQSSYEAKIADYSKRLENMEIHQRHQTQLIQTYIQQRDRYKLLYFEIMKDVGKPLLNLSMDGSMAENIEQVDEETPIASTGSISSASGAAAAQSPPIDKKIQELQEKLKEAQKAFQTQKDEYDEYRKEKLANDKIMNDQFNTMRSELRELTTTNCKLKNNFEFKLEKIKNLEKDVSDYKKQISALEERSKVYDSTIMKQEQQITYLREELFANQKKLSHAEVANRNLKQQYDMLRDSEIRIKTERDALYAERQKQNVVLNNLELLKCQLDRSENEGRIRAEQRFDDTARECSALRRHLQEEQDRFRELSADLERRTKAAVDRATEEKAEVEKLQNELKELRGQLGEKANQNETLSQKLQEALTPNKGDNPVAKANKRARELQVKLDLANVEIEHLKKEVNTCRETIEHHSKIANESEIQLQSINDRYTEYRDKAEKEIHELKTQKTDLVSRVAELEIEIKLQINDAHLSNTDNNDQLTKTQQELREAYERIAKSNIELRDLREQVNILNADLKSTSDKYTKIISLHTSDLQQYSECKEKLGKLEDQIGKLANERDEAVAAWREIHDGNENQINQLKKEKEELDRRVTDLNAQNTALHDQLQMMSSTWSTAQLNNESTSEMDSSVSESTPQNDSIFNRSINENDGRDKLMSIIKYLRTEKDVALANVEVLRNENIRLTAELRILNNKVKELSDAKANDVSAKDENPLTTVKYTEVLRKLETLTALTDSNRMLRDERDSLLNRIKELTERNTKVENEMFPLQEQNRELSVKNEEMTTEISKLRQDVLQWRQRANALVERSNKNPEEFKRIQNEREQLGKMLSIEKEKIVKAEAELMAIKQEKQRIDNELAVLTKANQGLTEEKRKMAEDIATVKQANGRMSHEIIEIKNKLMQRDDEVKKMVDELNAKEAALTDTRNKETQIRKIAKRYKDSFLELQGKHEALQAEMAARPLEQQVAEPTDTNCSQVEKALNDRIKELSTLNVESREKNETLRTQNESLSKQIENKDNEHGNILKELNNSITSLTEEKKNISRELAQAKLSFEQVRSETDNAKFQNDSRISRLEKDLADQEKENKEIIARLTRENESLQNRLNQLHRQFGLQQGTKPTTSSGSMEKSPSDASRTANVKPMSGPSTQQSATVTPRRGGDTPLASIRPMSVQNTRTAAVLPTTNVASIHGGSSSSSTSSGNTAAVTALVPPQQVHTTGMTGEVMSTTSSHTDYMPATSSAASIVVAAVPPMASNSPETNQEAESVEDSSSSSSITQVAVQQAVALVSPRQHENAPQNIVAPQQVVDQLNAASTSASSSTSGGSQSITMSTQNRATSTSNTVTTSQAGHKRPREVETDSTDQEISSDHGQKKPQIKRTRVTIGSTSQSESSSLDVDYQVTTSSQRDQDDENILIVDDSDDEDEMPDDGPVEPDDAQFEDEGVEPFEEERQDAAYDASYGSKNLQSDNNEVDVDDSSEIPNQSENNAVVNDPAEARGDSSQVTDNSSQPTETQQIQAISASDAGTSGNQQNQTWRNNSGQAQPTTQPQTPTQQTAQQQSQMIYEESGDGIVPSTPTLYVPRRADGFSEAVSSPQPQIHSQQHQQPMTRFTFAESARPTEGIDDTRIDLTLALNSMQSVPEAEPGQSVQNAPSQAPRDTAASFETTTTSTTQNPPQSEPIAGTSSASASVSLPEVLVTLDENEDGSEFTEENASTTEADDHKVSEEIEDMEEEENTDGVSGTSGAGESSTEAIETEEEGREAEVATTYQTRSSRSGARGQQSPYPRRGRQMRRPQPIVWQDGSHSPMNQSDYQQQQGSPNRSFNSQQQQVQQGQRGGPRRRMRRPYNRY